MSHWNHRVVRQTHEGESWLGIHEAFYDIEGKVAWTDEPTGVTGATVEELRETLERMLRCLDKPIIEDVEHE